MIERYRENIEDSLKEYEDKSFEELMQRADEISEILGGIPELMKELLTIQGVLQARILKDGDLE